MQQLGLTPCCRATSRTGTALLELIVGLVAVLAVLAGMLQLATLSREHSRAMSAAREQAGAWSLSASAGPAANARYIRSPLQGHDAKAYTRDDTWSYAAPLAFQRDIVEHTSPDDAGWQAVARSPSDRLSALRHDPMPSALFGFVRGRDIRRVTILSAVRDLLYRSEQVNVEGEVWLTDTTGIY